MAVAAEQSGTQSATVTTEHTLASISGAGLFTLHVDMVNLAANDVVELRAYQKVLGGGTARVVWARTFSGAQPTDDMIKVSPGLGNELAEADGLKFTLKQTFGTGRSFPWKVLKYS